jgi:hypothetical protein
MVTKRIRETSDFVADVLELWWTNRHAAHPGVRLSPRSFRPITARLERTESLPKWSLVIHPEPG